jgi:hypothetical protein
MSPNVTLEKILDSIRTHEKHNLYDNEDTEQLFLSRYEELNGYRLINPFTLSENIRKGDIVRYSKNLITKVSCSATVMKIRYFVDPLTMQEDKTLIDQITLRSLQYKDSNEYWNISPLGNYIFKYHEPNVRGGKESKRKSLCAKDFYEKLQKNIAQQRKKVVNIPVSEKTKIDIMNSISPTFYDIKKVKKHNAQKKN